ncbi:MAG: HEPN domain-containing protein [Spirochaetaceae bacterium]|jgi:HEPN domain-containing protein|nr:HEPN domain-containing protein [Spirochaetaceae bacterium]
MKRYESWIDRAKSSYELSKAVISNDIYFEDLCYQAQQAAEKSLKGLMIYYGMETEFTHNIGLLLNELEKYTEIDDSIKNTMNLTNYAVQTRYPGEYNDITKTEYEEAVKLAKYCLDWVDNKIKKSDESK